MAATVLVAHGNTQRLKQAVELLRTLGFDVVATPDGGDAFARFFEADPALVICNRHLPSLEGPSFARMVRSQAPDVPVIILDDHLDPSQALEGDLDARVFVVPDPLTVDGLEYAVPQLIAEQKRALEQESDVEVEEQALPTSSANVFIVAALKRFQRDSNLLGLLDEAALMRVATLAKHEIREDGEVIIQQGERETTFYLVVEGQVRVTLAEKNGEEVARIGPGGFFGEMALLSDAQRSASVSAAGATTLLCFEREPFLPLLDEYPILRDVLSGVALQRTEENLWRVLFADDEVTESIAALEQNPMELPGLAEDTANLPGLAEALEGPEPESLANTAMAASPDEFGISIGGDDGSSNETPESMGAGELAESREVAPSPRAAKPAGATRLRAVYGKSLLLGLLAGAALGATMTFVGLSGSWRQEPADARSTAQQEVAPLGDDGDAVLPPGEKDGEVASDDELLDTEEQALQEDLQDDAEPEPEVALEPAAKTPATDKSATAAPFDDEKKREVRRAMFQAVKAERYGAAVALGEQLKEREQLDWEAELKLGEARFLHGQDDAAQTTFLDFVQKYPQNIYVGTAHFWLGEIYVKQGKKELAIKHFKAVAGDTKSGLQEQAQARLQELSAP